MTTSPAAHSLLAPLLLAAVVLLFLLRFWHLDADFPAGITWSGVVYTDEGWYANAAVRDIVRGDWYLDGDFNPAINMPVGQLLHRAVFEAFGISLASVRLTPLLAWGAVMLCTALLVRRALGNTAALLAALLLAAHPLGFAYSRLGIMEPVGMAFVAGALLAADRARGPRANAWLAAAIALTALAILAKSSMIFVVPLVAWLAWYHAVTTAARFFRPLAALFIPAFVILAHQAAAAFLYPWDYAYFSLVNMGARAVTGPMAWLANTGVQLVGLLALGKLFLAVCSLLVVAAIALSPAFRRDPRVHVLLAGGVLYFASLTLIEYGPPRYFLPLLVPVCALAALAAVELARIARAREATGMVAAVLGVAPAVLLVILAASGALRIADWQAHPAWSFRDMARGVGDIIRAREGHREGVVLLGHFADSVALETGVRAVNVRFGLLKLRERLERHRPGYVLVHRDRVAITGAVNTLGGRLEKLGSWEVYGNTYLGERNPVTRKLPGVKDAVPDGPGPGRAALRSGHRPVVLYAIHWPEVSAH